MLYVAGCSNGATACSGNTRNAMDPRNGQIILPPAGAANTSVLIGTPIPERRQPARTASARLVTASPKYGYTWPALVFGPRFGAAYDITGDQSLDRPRRRRPLLRSSGRQHRLLDPEQPADHQLGGPAQRHAGRRSAAVSHRGAVPGMTTFQYDADVPASWQWQVGVQMALPWASSLDVSYVGNRGVNRLGGFQNGNAGQPERG